MWTDKTTFNKHNKDHCSNIVLPQQGNTQQGNTYNTNRRLNEKWAKNCSQIRIF